MTPPTRPRALQLYTVRDDFARAPQATLERVAALGYTGVEMAGVPVGHSAAQVRAMCDALGLSVPAAHLPLADPAQRQAALDQAAALGVTWAVVPYLAPFQDADGVARAAELLNEVDVAVRAAGLTLLYHNHDVELRPLPDGTIPLARLRDTLDASVGFELDVYWVQTAGHDPVTWLRALGPRVPLLHLKDGPADHPASPQVALGDGVVDLHGSVAAAEHAAWWVVELDRAADDLWAAVGASVAWPHA